MSIDQADSASLNSQTANSIHGRVLVVDDDNGILRMLAEALPALNFEVATHDNAEDGLRALAATDFDVILTDLLMPGMDGIQLLQSIRQHDLEIPVVLMTGTPTVDSAIQALEYGAYRYLKKPVRLAELQTVLLGAARQHKMAHLRLAAATIAGEAVVRAGDLAGLEARFGLALETLRMDFQPILNAKDGTIYGYEALMRCDEPSIGNPGAMLEVAERVNGLHALGRAVRESVVKSIEEAEAGWSLFVNLHPEDLLDQQLGSPTEAFSKIADRVVLEITERSRLERIPDVRSRIRALREIGFRIAVDDLGAGYSGLASFAQLEPEIVKLDRSLVQHVDSTQTKQKLVRSINALSRDMGVTVVAEGVETVAERDSLLELGCDLFQGFLFARPAPPFASANWETP